MICYICYGIILFVVFFFNISDVPNQLYKEIIANARLTCDS